MKNKHLVSIITPIYNGEKFISETIQSVINQTYQEWEMIIIDNCSTDNSVDIIKLYQKKNNKIKYIKLDYNSGGPARPRNVGIENAKGEYIAFLDADDVWMNRKLEIQLNIMIENNLYFTSTYASIINDKSIEMHLGKLSKYYNDNLPKKTFCNLIENNFILTSSVLVKKVILSKFTEDERLVAVEDYDLWLRILDGKIENYLYINEKLIQYRILNNSMSDRKEIYQQEVKANIAILNFILDNKQFSLMKCYVKRVVFYFVRKYIKDKIK